MQKKSERKRLLEPLEKSNMDRSKKLETERSKKSESSEKPMEAEGPKNGLKISAAKMPKKATEDEFAKGPFGFVYTLAWIGLVWVMGFGFGSGITYIHYLRLGETPIYFGEDSFIGKHPHIIFEPNPAVWNPKGHGVIRFNPTRGVADDETSDLIVQYRKLIQRYNDTPIFILQDPSNPNSKKIPRVNCANFSGNADGRLTQSTCIVDWQSDDYGPCALTEDNIKHDLLGLNSSSPCVMIRLSNMLGWFPRVKKEKNSSRSCEEKPAHKRCCHRRRIKFDCVEGEQKQNGNMIAYEQYPKDGMDSCAFPYWNQQNYQSPFVMLKFNLTKPETTVTCGSNLLGVDGKAGEVKLKFKIKK